MSNVLVTNISELVTSPKDLGTLKNGAWLCIDSGKVKAYGAANSSEFLTLQKSGRYKVVDAGNKLVMPGLIDCHTHPLFAGVRADEFAMRLKGATYQEIAAAGGGITYSVTNTRKASDEQLTSLLHERLNAMLSHGVTTVEVKSGYGLSVEEELRHLRILNKYKAKTPQHLEVTALPLHAIPKDTSKEKYLKDVIETLIPTIAREKLASAADAFIEEGYFSDQDCRPYFDLCQKLGLKLHVHAEEFTRSGGSKIAADYKALSADHLQYASAEDATALAKAGTVAVLLPGTSLYSKIPFTQAKVFLDAGCRVAIATDFNPGSCTIDNLNLIASVGAIHCGLNLAETISAVTTNAAHALGLQDHKGLLTAGYDADFVIYHFKSANEWIADFGKTKPASIWIAGNPIRV